MLEPLGTAVMIFLFAILMKIAEIRSRNPTKNYCSKITYKKIS